MTHTFSHNIDDMFEEIERFARLQREYHEQTLAEIITQYDFIVGSKECKYKLMGILPEGASIICSPYIESPTTIYAIKKFDVMGLLLEPHEPQEREVRRMSYTEWKHGWISDDEYAEEYRIDRVRESKFENDDEGDDEEDDDCEGE